MNGMSVIIMKCQRAGKSQSDRLSHIDHTLLRPKKNCLFPVTVPKK